MNEIITCFNGVADVFLKISVTVSLLMISWAFSKRIVRPSVSVSVAKTATLSNPLVGVEDQMPPRPPLVAGRMVAEEVVEDQIECGNCHNIVRSQPVSRTDDADVYNCETCGMGLKVPN